MEAAAKGSRTVSDASKEAAATTQIDDDSDDDGDDNDLGNDDGSTTQLTAAEIKIAKSRRKNAKRKQAWHDEKN